jgi:hypothetical protein
MRRSVAPLLRRSLLRRKISCSARQLFKENGTEYPRALGDKVVTRRPIPLCLSLADGRSASRFYDRLGRWQRAD